jgi:tetratricopeptide (TPR) repeat protein
MRANRFGISILALAASIGLNGCAKKEQAADASASPSPASSSAPKDSGKIPITTSSEAARAEFLQGRDLQDKLRVTDSIAHFAKAAQLDPQFALAELNLSNTAPTGKVLRSPEEGRRPRRQGVNGERLHIRAAEAGANGDAVKHTPLEQLVAAYPNDERAHFTAGAFLFGQQDYPKAIEHYKKSVEINPGYSGTWNILGYAYRQLGDYANAEQAFRKYVELIPGDPNPYDSLAELYLKEGKFDDSISNTQALEIDPNFLNSHQESPRRSSTRASPMRPPPRSKSSATRRATTESSGRPCSSSP